ncbi:Uncharacterised protein [Bordetella pertussis]|nr:Uncharacterised protein [Bordetella pertussis]
MASEPLLLKSTSLMPDSSARRRARAACCGTS